MDIISDIVAIGKTVLKNFYNTIYPNISSGTAAPTLTPTKVGDIYVDTTNVKFYEAKGTSSSADWVKQNGCYTLTASTANTLQTIVDSTAYFFGALTGATPRVATNTENNRMYVPKSGTIIHCNGTIVSNGAGSAEDGSVYVNVNDTTDYLIADNIKFNTARTYFSNASLSVPVSASDYVAFKVVTPAFATNPEYLSGSGVMTIEL